MTNSMNTMRFFMQHERVHVALSDSIAVVYLRAQSCALAETRLTKETTQSALLAADLGDSVVRVNTQAQTESVTYNVYGLHSHGEIPPQRPAFNGHLLVSHLYLLGNGYRAYNSVLMRFQSPDSLSPFTVGGLNCYAYCTGDPINYADPSGHGRILRSPSPTGRMSPGWSAAGGNRRRLSSASEESIVLEVLNSQPGWSAAGGKRRRLSSASEERIVQEALNSQPGWTTPGSPYKAARHQTLLKVCTWLVQVLLFHGARNQRCQQYAYWEIRVNTDVCLWMPVMLPYSKNITMKQLGASRVLMLIHLEKCAPLQ